MIDFISLELPSHSIEGLLNNPLLNLSIRVNEVTGEENACYWPAACGLAKAGQFCHAATNTVNAEPCDPRETTFTMTTDRRQTIHVCAAYPLLQ